MSALSIANPAPSDRRLTGGILFLLAGLAALGALATNIILPAFPRIGGSLGVSSQELGLTLSSFFVAFGFGQLLVGPLSDRFGRKWLVLGGLAVFVTGSVLCAFADTLSFLILGRVIQALGACAASVLSPKPGSTVSLCRSRLGMRRGASVRSNRLCRYRNDES